MKETVRKMIAEFVGTFALVFIGAGSILAQSQGAALGYLGIGLAHGLILMAMIYALGHVSGAHFNPAITFAQWITRHIKTTLGILYIVAQLAGAAVAGLFLKVVFAPSFLMLSGGAPQVSAAITPGMAILIEAVATFLLVWTVYGTAVDKKNDNAGLAIGMVLTVSIFLFGALTGGALNPARAFGPSLVSNLWTDHFVYWVGPLLGGLFAGIIYRLGIMKGKKIEA